LACDRFGQWLSSTFQQYLFQHISSRGIMDAPKLPTKIMGVPVVSCERPMVIQALQLSLPSTGQGFVLGVREAVGWAIKDLTVTNAIAKSNAHCSRKKGSSQGLLDFIDASGETHTVFLCPLTRHSSVHKNSRTEAVLLHHHPTSCSRSRGTSGRNQPLPEDRGGIDESTDLSRDR
jgi:hypothetical protein